MKKLVIAEDIAVTVNGQDVDIPAVDLYFYIRNVLPAIESDRDKTPGDRDQQLATYMQRHLRSLNVDVSVGQALILVQALMTYFFSAPQQSVQEVQQEKND